MITRSQSRVDACAGLIVAAIGLIGLVESWAMPRFENRGADPYTVPGLTPGLLSAVLCVLGLALFARAFLRPVGKERVPLLDWTGASARRVLFTITTAAVYGFLLFGNVPFLIATTGFIFVFTVGAELLNPDLGLSRARLLSFAFVFAFCAAFLIRFVFVEIFLVRLP